MSHRILIQASVLMGLIMILIPGAYAASVVSSRYQIHSLRSLDEVRGLERRVRQEGCQVLHEGDLKGEAYRIESPWDVAIRSRGFHSVASEMVIKADGEAEFFVTVPYPLVEAALLCWQTGSAVHMASYYLRDQDRQDLASGRLPYPLLKVTPGSGAQETLEVHVLVHSSLGVFFPNLPVSSANATILSRYDAFLNFAAVGGILAIFLYNVFLWLGARKKIYSINVAYIGSLIVFNLVFGYFVFQFAMLSTDLKTSQFILHILNLLATPAAALSGAIVLYFGLVFAESRQSYPRFYPWAILVVQSGLLFALVSLFAGLMGYVQFVGFLVRNYITVVGVILILFLVYDYSRTRNRFASIFVLSYIPLIIGSLTAVQFIEGVIPPHILSKNGIIIGNLVESMLLSFSVGYRVRLIENEAAARAILLSEKLQSINQDLESKVSEKIQDIRSVMENINEAIFTVARGRDGQLMIMEDKSLASYGLFPRMQKTPTGIAAWLDEIVLPPEEKSKMETILECSISEDMTNFEINQDQLPAEVVTISARTLDLSYRLISSDGRVTDKLLVCIRDVTDRRELLKNAAIQQQSDEMTREILNCGVLESKKALNLLQQTLAADLKLSLTAVEIMRNLHTAKGLSRYFNFATLSHAIHEVEGEVLAQTLSPAAAVDKAVARLSAYQDVFQRKFGDLQQPQTLGSVELRSLQHFILTELKSRGCEIRLSGRSIEPDILLSDILKPESLARMRNLKTLHEMFAPIHDEMLRIARQLGKEPPRLLIKGDRVVAMDQTVENRILGATLHAMRNSVDHGIEKPDVRLTKGKAPEGTFCIELLQLSDSSMTLLLYDDGAGIDMGHLRQKAVAAAADQVLFEILFQDGFSSKRAVDDISGRGIGMSAIRDVAKSLKGHARIVPLGPEVQGRIPCAIEFECQLHGTLPITFAAVG